MLYSAASYKEFSIEIFSATFFMGNPESSSSNRKRRDTQESLFNIQKAKRSVFSFFGDGEIKRRLNTVTTGINNNIDSIIALNGANEKLFADIGNIDHNVRTISGAFNDSQQNEQGTNQTNE